MLPATLQFLIAMIARAINYLVLRTARP